MKIGDRVTRNTVTMSDTTKDKDKKTMTGRVVYIHPEERYHVVEFSFPYGSVRESFYGVEL